MVGPWPEGASAIEEGLEEEAGAPQAGEAVQAQKQEEVVSAVDPELTPEFHTRMERLCLRTVDSWMQLVDRLIICRLKQWHYDREQRHEEAQHARDQGDELQEAAELYLQECLSGDREPRVHQHLRYHRHDAEEVHPSSVMDAVSRLAACHAEYWQHQSEILRMRQCIDALGSSHKDKEYRDRLVADVEHEQRTCDRCNQLRNELVQKGDDLLRRMWEKRTGLVIIGDGTITSNKNMTIGGV